MWVPYNLGNTSWSVVRGRTESAVRPVSARTGYIHTRPNPYGLHTAPQDCLRLFYGFRIVVCRHMRAWKYPFDQSCGAVRSPVRPVSASTSYIPTRPTPYGLHTAPQNCLRLFYGHKIVGSQFPKVMHTQLSATGYTALVHTALVYTCTIQNSITSMLYGAREVVLLFRNLESNNENIIHHMVFLLFSSVTSC